MLFFQLISLDVRQSCILTVVIFKIATHRILTSFSLAVTEFSGWTLRKYVLFFLRGRPFFHTTTSDKRMVLPIDCDTDACILLSDSAIFPPPSISARSTNSFCQMWAPHSHSADDPTSCRTKADGVLRFSVFSSARAYWKLRSLATVQQRDLHLHTDRLIDWCTIISLPLSGCSETLTVHFLMFFVRFSISILTLLMLCLTYVLLALLHASTLLIFLKFLPFKSELYEPFAQTAAVAKFHYCGGITAFFTLGKTATVSFSICSSYHYG